ncbi:MAG: tRNA-intron lyase [Thermoplasmatota archaeon]
MPGKLTKNKVIISDQDEGNQIYNKGYFGKPLSGGGLELDFYESLYLLETDRLNIVDVLGKDILKEDLMEYVLKNNNDDALIEYPIYRDMRRRGYVIKQAGKPANFRVFPRGGGPGKTRSRYWVFTMGENDTFSVKEITEYCQRISKIKKDMVAGIMDEEGDVTYYKISTIDLKGRMRNDHEITFEGVLLGDKCLIKDGEELHERYFFGNIIDDDLYLSLVEAYYLMEKYGIKIRKGLNKKYLNKNALKKVCTKRQDNFDIKYRLYSNLRDNGVIPKTGFKYGAAFRCYKGDPDKFHAEYIVQPVSNGYEIEWYHVSRAVRVAHSVKKEFVYGVVEDKDIVYIKIERITP